ncbi:MAG: hypothetical protein U0744_05060 [Gemmataceae bacterium]
MKKFLATGLLALGAMVALLGTNHAGLAPKYTTSEVMKKAMKGGLCAKVASGKASAEEQKQLVELFEAMCENKAPKGEQKAWVSKCEALIKAAKDGDGKALKAAANCKACHDVHK